MKLRKARTGVIPIPRVSLHTRIDTYVDPTPDIRTYSFTPETIRSLKGHIGTYSFTQTPPELGGMSRVFAVQDEKGRFYAAKLPDDTNMPAIPARNLIIQEARVLTHLSHPHIIRLIDFGVEPLPFLILELAITDLRANTLALEVAEVGPFPVSRAICVIEQLCDAFSFVHANGIVYNDLNPGNVFISSERGDHITLFDFGLATFIETVKNVSLLNAARISYGEPQYVAPERLVGGITGVQGDVFTLGGLLYELLTGKPPFPLTSYRNEHTLPEAPSSCVPSLPIGLARVMMRALDLDPIERYQSAEEFRRAIGGCFD